MSHPCSSCPRSNFAVATDRRVVAGRIRRMGITLSELPNEHRESVRTWAGELTEVEVEMLAVTARAIRGHDDG